MTLLRIQQPNKMRPFIAVSGFLLLILTLFPSPIYGGASLADDAENNRMTIAPPKVLFNILPIGNIDDVQCNIEDVERANDSQLNAIFRELLQTSFFRHFVVDLEHKCPLSLWTGGDSSSSPTDEADDEEEEEFECSGGEDLGLDEEAEPLCTVDTGGGDDAFGGASGMMGGGTTPFESSVLQSLSESGFSSTTQKDTFDWQTSTDLLVEEDDSPCDEEDPNLPDTFWNDMCNNIQVGDGKKLVDLALNPERNTGYNGTHIWKAIYEENCITTSDSCLEERVLYRLLSGLHASTTVSIAKHYYPPSKRKNRINWEPNPQYFMDKFQRHPDHVRNLHFGYVVLLRAIRKATSYLTDYDIQSGNTMDDEASKVLLKRLLDTAILQSCSSIFSAFDESVMFQDEDIGLQQNFKGVFHNISSILDCVQCQQCKLHGKMSMMGYGTALKILFVNPDHLTLDRNEVVALINTAGRLSESLIDVHDLTAMYWLEQEQIKGNSPLPTATEGLSSTLSPTISSSSSRFSIESLDLVDTTVGAIATLGAENLVSLEREQELVKMALEKHPELLILGKHYASDVQKFLAMTSTLGDNIQQSKIQPPDAVIVGSGLAGLSAALNILDRGGTVVLVEKEHLLGGNSNKASSGINGCCPQNDTYGDSLESFRNDTVKSAGVVADLGLIDTLVSNSERAVLWLRDRANVDLSLLAQLGGHSYKRTHRPSNGMAGAEIIYHMQKEVKAYEKTGKVAILLDTRVLNLITDEDERVVGVACESTIDGTAQEILADTVILATGGFASDRSAGSYLDQNRPELMSFPATAGSFSTGDGITLATALGASTRDMDKVQIHPTGWVDPKDPSNPTKVLAAELMRGVGGILINGFGERFCNELGTRAYVTDRMLQHDPYYKSNGKWKDGEDVQTFSLVLASSAAADGKKHVDLYTHKGLLTKVEGLAALAKHTGLSKKTLEMTIRKYQSAALDGEDEFGKTSFRGVPAKDLSTETFYVGTVTPVLHYCMGGIKIDSEGHVLREDQTVIAGLRAAGEVTGGVHGNNRLGGNSLLECTVYGTIVGESVRVKDGDYRIALSAKEDPKKETVVKGGDLPVISLEELSNHNTEEDLWVAIHGVVYDFTEFAHEHPAGFESIFELAGTDGTDAFSAVHNKGMLDDFEEDKKGLLGSG